MKAYIITQAQMDALTERLELSKLRQADNLPANDRRQQDLSDMHRSFIYVVATWIDEVSK